MSAAAFFDMDGVLVRGESQFSFLLWCLRRGVAPRLRALPVIAQYVFYLSGLSRDALRLRESGYALLRDVPVDKLRYAASEFLHEDLSHRFRRQTAPLLEAHRRQGHLIVLLTSACEPMALPVAAKLKCDAVIATRLLANGISYTGQRALPEPYGTGKRVLVEEFCETHAISPAECFAYADHHSDTSLLEFVGNPVAANPCRKLNLLAKAKGWPVVDLDAATMQAANTPSDVHSC